VLAFMAGVMTAEDRQRPRVAELTERPDRVVAVGEGSVVVRDRRNERLDLVAGILLLRGSGVRVGAPVNDQEKSDDGGDTEHDGGGKEDRPRPPKEPDGPRALAHGVLLDGAEDSMRFAVMRFGVRSVDVTLG